MNPRITALVISTLALSGPASAADAGAAGCKTTEECAAQAARIGAFVPAPVSKGNTTSPLDLAEDQFYWMNKINKASVVMLVEERILPPETGPHDRARHRPRHRPGRAARRQAALRRDADREDHHGRDRPDGSLIHAGRTRQDMYATFRAAQLRNQVLDFSDAINSLRDRMLVTVPGHG